jgi:AraC-like DNA-binding protein
MELSLPTALQPVANGLAIRSKCTTDNVRVEFLRCVGGSTIRWNMARPEMSLMWIHDRGSNARITYTGGSAATLAQGRSNCWYFPEGVGADGEVTADGAYDCAAISVDPTFLPPPAREALTEPLAGFLSDQLGRGFTQLGEELQEPDVYVPLIAEGWAVRALAQVARLAGPAQQRQNSSKGGLAAWQLRHAKELFRSRLSQGISLRHAAEACRLSVSQFARSFKISTGIPPHRWIMRLRLEKAQELLEHSSMPLVEVAVVCGFTDQSHLSRVFMQATGTSPGSWRREHQVRRFA